MRHFSTLVLLAVFATGVSAEEQIRLLQFQTFIPHASFSPYADGLDRSTHTALNAEKEWRKLWDESQQRTEEESKLPRIDFERNTLLVIALGSRPTGGFRVVLEGIREFPSEIQITAYELTPGDDCIVTTAVTHPIAYALISRTQKPVHFNLRKVAVGCSQ